MLALSLGFTQRVPTRNTDPLERAVSQLGGEVTHNSQRYALASHNGKDVNTGLTACHRQRGGRRRLDRSRGRTIGSGRGHRQASSLIRAQLAMDSQQGPERLQSNRDRGQR